MISATPRVELFAASGLLNLRCLVKPRKHLKIAHASHVRHERFIQIASSIADPCAHPPHTRHWRPWAAPRPETSQYFAVRSQYQAKM